MLLNQMRGQKFSGGTEALFHFGKPAFSSGWEPEVFRGDRLRQAGAGGGRCCSTLTQNAQERGPRPPGSVAIVPGKRHQGRARDTQRNRRDPSHCQDAEPQRSREAPWSPENLALCLPLLAGCGYHSNVEASIAQW